MARALRRGAGRLAAPFIAVAIRPASTPIRLLIAPQDIRVADPTVANDIYAGYVALAGRVVNGHGRSPFDLEAPTAAWAEALHGFSWLRHLRAADTALARANARALVEDWMTSARTRRSEAAWRIPVVARRLISWLSQSPIILDGADGLFYRRLMRSLVQQGALLRRALVGGLAGEDRLWAALALAEISLCVDRTSAIRRASRAFVEELGRQILPDGGHVSRNPQVLVDLLLDLLPLRHVYAARGVEVPPPLLNAIDRMMPMLRLFRHADGSLASFNGMRVTEPEGIAIILAYDDAAAMPQTNAIYSGYQRLTGGDGVLICDTGKPPPVAFSGAAQAGTLSFEFSTEGQLLIVNCGRPGANERGMTMAARATAAHSTLVLDDTSSSRFILPGRGDREGETLVLSGPRAVTAAREARVGMVAIEASHDGYAPQGVIHRRRLALRDDGLSIEGCDDLEPAPGADGLPGLPYAIRFHLHPLARASFSPDGRSIDIDLAHGRRWRFEAQEVEAGVEESIYFGGAEGPRRTEQIVLHATLPKLATIHWSLTARDRDAAA